MTFDAGLRPYILNSRTNWPPRRRSEPSATHCRPLCADDEANAGSNAKHHEKESFDVPRSRIHSVALNTLVNKLESRDRFDFKAVEAFQHLDCHSVVHRCLSHPLFGSSA